MKALLVYWVLGCSVAGLATGKYMERCPNDDMPMSELTMVVATWPAFLFMNFTAPRGLPPSPCTKLTRTSVSKPGESNG